MVATEEWDWQLYPETEAFLSGLVRSFLDRNGYADIVRGEIESATSTRFIDWVDHMELPIAEVSGNDLARFGYERRGPAGEDGNVYGHPGGRFFTIILRSDGEHRLSIKVDDLDRFLLANHLTKKTIQGGKDAPLRSAELNRADGHSFQAMERHGSSSFEIVDSNDLVEYTKALDALSSRNRVFDDDVDGIDELMGTIAALKDILTGPRVADAFFRAERMYWQGRNRAGLVQLNRQERLGLGWGNHDHHAFRCSRGNFGNIVTIFEELGMERRERFFAGAQAGWGAQVMEHPETGHVIFADVDLGPGERHTELIGTKLEPLDKLGTIGLWVGLHGESVLDSGMHHLAVGSDFMGMREDLKARDVVSMGPFSDFDFLKQSFTEAERWTPSRARVDRLVGEGLIQEMQASKFIGLGALGSHLEIIQRNRGFKGFNQDSVNAIIRMTDPLKRSEIGA